jgi:predicted dehydrogenase
MAHKIRLGFVGANVRATWASQSHFPALLASPDVELTVVCTTRPESAEEARAALGAKFAFHDFRAMVASPEIDAVAAVHVAAVPWAGSGFRMEIYGREGTLVATGTVSSQRGEMLRLQDARGSHELRELAIPERFVYVPADFPRGDPFNVGQMYALFAAATRTGQSRVPTFDTAVDLHRFLATIKQASETGRALPVA